MPREKNRRAGTPDFTLCLRWSDEYVGQFESEPSNYIFDIAGQIVALDGVDDPVAGHFELTYVDFEGVSATRILFERWCEDELCPN